jgi:alpha-ketoglutarate-dependent taurine dioxygenase
MAFTSIEISPRLGSQLEIDKGALLSGEYAEQIRSLLDERGILLVRGENFDDDELRTVACTLGDLRLGSAKRGSDGATLKEGDGGVLKISLDEKVNPEYARFLFGNQLWHMDGTYEEIPPLATLFTPRLLATQGGDTMFANTYAAFEDLPDDEKARLEELRAIHTMEAALFPAKRSCTVEEFAVWHSYPNRSHPLVWHHKSGRKSLVLSTSAAYIEGIQFAESHDMLQRLMAHATQDKYTYRHKWQMGDLVIWDNTGSMHRAMPFDEEGGRIFHRCTLNGEEPVTGVSERVAQAA